MTNMIDIELATFALGRFVQYRLDEGMTEECLAPFMNAYFNLTADLDCRERLAPHELQAQIEAVGLVREEEDVREWPVCLRGHERLRCRLRAQHKCQSKTDLDVQEQPSRALGSNA